MPAPATPAAVQSVTSLDNADESPTTALYRAAIGPINNDYYLPIFQRFEAADRVGVSWNWAASLYTLNWMAFRRLWKPAFAYIAIMLGSAMTLGLGHVLFEIPPTTEISLWAATGLLSFVVPGLYGNALLHAASRKKMAHALAVSSTMLQATALLTQQAGSRRHFFWLGLVNLALGGAAMVVYGVVQSVTDQQHLAPQKVQAKNMASGTLATSTPLASATKSMPAASELVTPSPPPSTVVAVATAPAPVSSEPLKEKKNEGKPSALKPANPPPVIKHKQGKSYYVNVGLFAEELNANNAKNKLSTAGLTAFTQELKTAKGKRTRVRVGPFGKESEAVMAATKIRSLKLEAMVISQ